MKERNKIEWLFASRDNKELAERYAQWAKDYDAPQGASCLPSDLGVPGHLSLKETDLSSSSLRKFSQESLGEPLC